MKPKAYHNTPDTDYLVWFITSSNQVKEVNTKLKTHTLNVILVIHGKLWLQTVNAHIIVQKNEGIVYHTNNAYTIQRMSSTAQIAICSYTETFLLLNLKHPKLRKFITLVMSRNMPKAVLDKNHANLLYALLKFINTNRMNTSIKQDIEIVCIELILLWLYNSYIHILVPSLINNHHQKTIIGFFLLLNKHYRSQHSVRFYAQSLHKSTNHLYKIIKKLNGRSPSAYINIFLVNRAKQLLIKDNSIQHISESLGFRSPAHFSKFFKKHTNHTPSAFRNISN